MAACASRPARAGRHPDRQRSRHAARSSGSIPASIGLKNLYDLGKVAVIQGCGYPEYSLSHEESRAHLGDGQPARLGALPAPAGSAAISPRTTARPTSRASRSATRSPASSGRRRPAFSRSGASTSSASPTTTSTATTTSRPSATRSRHLCAAASGGEPGDARSTSATAGRRRSLSSESYPPLDGTYEADRAAWNQLYDDLGSSTARDLREVAKIIYGVAERRPERRRALLPAEQRRLRHPLRPGRRRSPTASTTRCIARSATALKVFYDDSPTWASPTRSACWCGASSPPHPAERQRHRPRLAGRRCSSSAAR